MQPDVSIIIPCCNQAQYLPEALESVLAQTFNNWECIVVDDGSTDNVTEVVESFLKKDNRIIFYSIRNGGPSAARNFGIANALGTYILPLDADDKISTNYIEECYKTIHNSDITVVYGAGEKFGLVNEKIKRAECDWNKLLFGNMIHVSGMYRKADWKSIGGYDEQMRDGVEDWEFWINLLKQGKKVVQLQNVVFYQRVNNISRTAKLHNSGSETKLRQYVYCKYAELYQHLFTDPLKVYEEKNYYKGLWRWAKEHPLKFLLSLSVKKKNRNF